MSSFSRRYGGACSDSGPPLASPDLECDGDASGTSEADLDPMVPGAATIDEALGGPGDTPATEARVTADASSASGGSAERARQFCSGAADALDNGSYPTNGAGLIDSLRAIDAQGLNDLDLRAFSAAVADLERSIEALTTDRGRTAGPPPR